ncbi:putative hydrolase [Colletotrichum shisoi]|uniref:Putative hydrolase n=1 Tax=Colletotrichum shisoi TaxID=2078593 RepID=A0A5Q4BN24_9PEZI|nr:putative hydrolase [Colletotrichum shisoi]
MLTSKPLSRWSLLAVLAGTALITTTSASDHASIEWRGCDDVHEIFSLIGQKIHVPIECSNVTVPLDYAEPNSTATLDLKVIKVPALKQPSKGNVILHFGGPTDSGRLSMAALSETMQMQGFDLIGWEQRGTWDTMPLFCSDKSQNRSVTDVPQVNMAVTPDDRMNVGRNWAFAEVEAQRCYEYAKDKGAELVGTMYTVRDAWEIVDALGGDRLLRFWGISYGTVVGSTAAALHPDRVERLVLDGVTNPQQWWAGETWEMLTDTDKVFSGFLRTCFEKPDACVLAAKNPNATAAQLESKIYGLIDDLKYRPIPVPVSDAIPLGIIDQNMVKGVIRMGLYTPSQYPALAARLQLLLDGDIDALIEGYAATWATNSLGDIGLTIPCTDNALRVDDLEDLMSELDRASKMSRLAGDLLSWNSHMCARWKLNSKEKFTRGFHEPIDTRSPLLIFGNEYDVVTPYVSARNISTSFPRSALVKYNAFGHGIQAQPSLCTVETMKRYLEDGVLPAEDTVCEPAAHVWESQDWATLWEELGYQRPDSTA